MSSDNHTDILDKITEYCGKSVHKPMTNETEHRQWDFYNSFYFAYTVVSTIGRHRIWIEIASWNYDLYLSRT